MSASLIESGDDSEAGLWHSAALVRYRSRRDLMEMIPATLGSEHHGMKLAALDKTLSIPASPWFMWGGPKVLIPLVLILLSVLGTCVVTGQAADQALARHGPARRIASTVHH